MQELVQIEDHDLSPLVELAVKFTELYNYIFRKSKTDRMGQNAEIRLVIMGWAIHITKYSLLCLNYGAA
jgi:hypothetical protein